MIIANDVNTLYKQILGEVLEQGTVSSPRGNETLEVDNLSFKLLNPKARLLHISQRPINQSYCVASLIWNLLGRNDLDSISHYNQHGKIFSDVGQTLYGSNWGQRINPGIEQAINKLKLDPDSRRAFIPVWSQKDTNYNQKDLPCLVGIQLLIRNNKLDFHTWMRSQSLIGVFAYDIFLLTAYAELIANELQVELGTYIQHTTSMHIYKREIAKLPEHVEPSPEIALRWQSRAECIKSLEAKFLNREDLTEGLGF